jgi:hypothetical protein
LSSFALSSSFFLSCPRCVSARLLLRLPFVFKPYSKVHRYGRLL